MKYEKFPPETIYGSRSRYEWIKSFLNKDQKIVDLGCGTGSMITIPLIEEGFDVLGVDLDSKSIEYGKGLLKEKKLDPSKLTDCNFSELLFVPDVVIVSEVLEHIETSALHELLSLILKKLSSGGLVLVTIPNGYGFFEFDSFIWNKLKLGKFLIWSTFDCRYTFYKNKYLGYNTVINIPSSLDSSPHVQSFTYYSLPYLFKQYDFKVKSKQGGTFISGPTSNLLFTGFGIIMKINMFLGRLFPVVAADFYMAFIKK